MGKKIFRNPNFQETDYRLTDNPSPHFTTKVEEKIKHDHKCKVCGKPAEITTELTWIVYDLDSEGNYNENTDYDREIHHDEVNYFCYACFEKGGNWN